MIWLYIFAGLLIGAAVGASIVYWELYHADDLPDWAREWIAGAAHG